MGFIKDVTNFIFLSDSPQKSDVIFIPGNRFPQPGQYAARLYGEGYAPLVVPSGRFSVTLGYFPGPVDETGRYPGPYESEWAFIADVLCQNGVPWEAVVREDRATFTWENALLSKQALDAQGVHPKQAIVCCKPYHARRCKAYYEMAFPDTRFFMCPVATDGVTRENWMHTKEGVERVMGELERCGRQFAGMLGVK